MSAPFIVAVPKKQPLQQGTQGRAELDLVASVTECENAQFTNLRWLARALRVPSRAPRPPSTHPRARVGPRSFRIPALKIGTYDKLVQLSDDIEKVSSTVESTTARLYKQLLDSKCVSSHRRAEKEPPTAPLSPAHRAAPASWCRVADTAAG